jgi:glycosyltransferase involved in cell wall biosynthesis
MDSTTQRNADPKVSVIVPARNEELSLERCLRSLVVQRGVPFEIIIVDDASTDRTRQIAESFTRARQCPFIAANEFLLEVRVIDAPQPLPDGWTGKTNALVAAEAIARGEWLLFTDADTEHLEGSLAAAIAEAEEHKAALLSYSPEQLLAGIRQQLVMPVLFAELALKYSPRRVNDPALPDAAANGQYMLVRAEVHRRLGGFAAVATELLEDVALARIYKANKEPIRFRMGRGLVRTRMYRSWEELRAGWAKNLALLFPDARWLASKRIQEFRRLLITALIAPLWTLWFFAQPHSGGDLFWPALLAVYWFFTLIGFAMFYGRIARAHFRFAPSLFSIFGLPLFARLLRESVAAYAKGTILWRGRSYSGNRVVSRSLASNRK